MGVKNLATYGATLAIAWGAFSFGAVYPWGYWPLIFIAVASGTAGLALRESYEPRATAFGIALVVLCIAVAAQLIPVPAAILAKFNPAADRLLQQFEFAYDAGLSASHPVSILPNATWLGLAFAVAFSIFAVGLTRSLSVAGCHGLAARAIVIGSIIAIVGIVQRGFSTTKIYGVWQPQYTGDSFDPFVNRNHFAGWMVMTLSLAVGYFCGGAAGAMRRVRPGWRNRLVWLASTQANKLVLTAFALVLMALSLVVSMSRSGITCLAIALILGGWFVRRQLGDGYRGTLIAGYLALVFVIAVGRIGIDIVSDRFAAASWETLGGRFGAWADAARVIRDFPLAGTG
ncbi:MAG TPA: O-antigen ligase family protein, partial [Candidatus Binatia bacterium]|nr:O-antigen ligase family protein [Candidatus Binatia bacterium]